MFTGIVEEIGSVQRIVCGARSIQVTIAAQTVLDGLATGDSVAVNGVCLTAARLGARVFTADVMPETMRRTGLGALQPGSPVNLERALTPMGRLGGHIVSGHIDGVGEIAAMDADDNAIIIRIGIASALAKYVVEKGSIAVDGVSLTVVGCGADWCSVSLIPHTAAATTLGAKRPGDGVNIETDIIGKYVERLLGFAAAEKNAPAGALTLEFLRNSGF